MTENKVVENAAGRKVPLEIDGKTYSPFAGAFAGQPVKNRRRSGPRPGTILHPGQDCLVPSIEDAITRIGLEDGMTISFHHHLTSIIPPHNGTHGDELAVPLSLLKQFIDM